MMEMDDTLQHKTKKTLDPKGEEAKKARENNGFFLNWDRADDLEEMPVWIKTIYTHEKILPQALIESVRKGSNQGDLFGSNFNGVKPNDRWQFWEHEANWQNRLIHGNSIEVMVSLLEKEKREGQVQCIFFDPPYGIDYKSIVANKQQGGGVNDALTNSGEARKAFADSYVRKNNDGTVSTGIAPYFDGIYRHLKLARRLLTDSGSIFLQISEVNVNRLSVLMDEVFGFENRVAMINYSTGAKNKKMLSSSGDYLLWYAKDKDTASDKYNQLYEPRNLKEYFEQVGGDAIAVNSTSGEIKLASEIDYSDFNKKWRVGRKFRLTSQDAGINFQSKPWPTLESKSKYGKTDKGKWKPSAGGHWRVNNPDGLDRLTSLNRLCCTMKSGVTNVKWLLDNDKLDTVPEKSTLQWIMFFDEDPGKKLGDVWPGGQVKNKWFLVETPSSVLEHCILMTTEPGDLVFDPTCGSGATAEVAEQWGRRWITSDAGAWQIALCRERLVTRTFDEFLLKFTKEGHIRDLELDLKYSTNVAGNSSVVDKFWIP